MVEQVSAHAFDAADHQQPSCRAVLPWAARDAKRPTIACAALQQPLPTSPRPPLQYFSRHASLASSYWHAVSRPNSSGLLATASTVNSLSMPLGNFSLLDGTLLPQPLPSSSPYAHWDWNLLLYAAKPGWDCGAVFSRNLYSSYAGSQTALALRDPTSYSQPAPGEPAAGGWSAYNCSESNRFICTFLAADIFPLPEPPQPPSEPPQPPSPPSPPLPPSCTPAASATFFCSDIAFNGTTRTSCYAYLPDLLTQPAAVVSCAAWGGGLVAFESSAEQLLVERYYRLSGVLSDMYYWTSIRRNGSGLPFVLNATSGELAPELVSEVPYGHWASYHPQMAATAGHDCVLAVAKYAYDYVSAARSRCCLSAWACSWR